MIFLALLINLNAVTSIVSYLLIKITLFLPLDIDFLMLNLSHLNV